EAAGQLLKAQSRARLVVLCPQARRQVLEYQRDYRSAGYLVERRDERHLAEEGRIGGDEADGFDDPARRRQFHEPHLDHVLSVGRLAAKSALIRRVEQRHAISAPDPRIEFVNLARHLGWREPVDEGGRVQEGRVERLGPRLDHLRGTGPGARMLFGHVMALDGSPTSCAYIWRAAFREASASGSRGTR